MGTRKLPATRPQQETGRSSYSSGLICPKDREVELPYRARRHSNLSVTIPERLVCAGTGASERREKKKRARRIERKHVQNDDNRREEGWEGSWSGEQGDSRARGHNKEPDGHRLPVA